MENNQQDRDILTKKVRQYFKEVDLITKKLGLNVRPTINFKSGKLTLFGRIGIWFLTKANGFIDHQFSLNKK